jgi:hypothetical protein
MSAHAEKPEGHGEALLAAYSHAASNPAAEWSYRHTEWYAAVTVFLLTLAVVKPVLAAVLALIVAGAMIGAGVVLTLRDAHGTCDQIIHEVQARNADRGRDE